MILGIELLTDSTKVIRASDGKILIVFDNKQLKDVLAYIWLTDGENESDFFNNKDHDIKALKISKRNKLLLRNARN